MLKFQQKILNLKPEGCSCAALCHFIPHWVSWLIKLQSNLEHGGGKKSDSEFLSYNLMLISGEKNCALCDKKNKYSNSCCPEKKFWMKKKNYSPPPCKLNGRSLTRYKLMNYTQKTSSWSYYYPLGWSFWFRRWFIHWKLWFVLVYRQTKANMLTLMLHETILII
jgi:hypothetical protein